MKELEKRLSYFLVDNLFPWVESKSNKRFYVYILVSFCVGLDLLFVFPKHFAFYSDAWDVVLLKSQHLTDSLTHIWYGSYLSKKVFRLTVPLIIKIFHMNELSVKIMQYALGITLLVHVYKIALNIFKDGVSATFVVVGTTFTYFGRTSFMEFEYATFDGWAYCFLILALYFRNRPSIFLFASAAAWTDERAFIILPALMLFHQIRDIENSDFGRKRLLSMNSSSATVLGAMIGYLALRQFLGIYFHMVMLHGEIGFKVFRYNGIYFPVGIGTFLVCFWLVFIVGIHQMVKQKDALLGLLILAQVGISTLVAGFVYDITRSGSYLFPIIFVLLVYLKNRIDRNGIRLLTFSVMTLNYIIPAYCIMRFWSLDHIEGRRIPIEFIKWLIA